jgi:hypothetical protein
MNTVRNQPVADQEHDWNGRECQCGQIEVRLRRLVLLDNMRRLVAQERRRVAEQWSVEDILRRES